MLTAVDRDDLPDGGALIFANTVREIHDRVPGARVEILSGDYRGDLAALDIVHGRSAGRFRAQSRNGRAAHAVGARQAREVRSVAAHAAPCQKRGHRSAIPRRRSCSAWAKPRRDRAAMDDARAAGVDIFTMGQYLQPSKKHLPVVEFVTPQKFDRLGALAQDQGISSGRLEPAFAQFVPRRTSLPAPLSS